MSKGLAVALCVECGITLDDEQMVEGSGLAVFGAEELGAQMGYKPGSFTEDDCLGAAQMMAERVAESLEWADAPVVTARMERGGGLIKAVVNPGFVGEEDWGSFTNAFSDVCALYGAKVVYLAQGSALESLLHEKLAAAMGPAVKPPKAIRSKAPKAKR